MQMITTTKPMPREVEFRSVLQLCGVFVLFCLVLGYVSFQARFLITGPQIALENSPAQLQNERKIFLEGRAVNISRLWLNDRQIYTDASGNFKEALILENGYTVATLRAEDRYGRETTLREDFYYAPATFIQ